MNRNESAENPLEALQQIRQAEGRARKIKRDAEEDASRKIIEDAHAEAAKIKDTIMAEAREKADQKRKTIIQDAENQAENIRSQAQEEMSSMQEIARKNREASIKKAAAVIQQRLTGDKD